MPVPPDPPHSPPPPPPDARAEADAKSSLGRNTALLSVGTLASRVLGMARETLIAATFDVAVTDVFLVALRVPNGLRAMFAEGAARYVFNPVLGEELHGTPGVPEDRPRLRTALSHVRGTVLLVLTVVSLLGVLLARPIFGVLSGHFSGDATRFELGVHLLRVLFPYIFFMGMFALGNSTLQLLNRFTPGAFAPMLYNVSFLVVPFAILPLLRPFGIAPIFSLAVAVLVGGVLQLLALRPALRRENMLPTPRLAKHRSLTKMASLFIPELYGQAVYQINIIVGGYFLSTLPTGSASFFSYAQRLADIPQGLFAVAISGAAAAALQRDATTGNAKGMAATYEEALRLAAFLAVPIAVILAVYGEAIVPVIFGYGRFRRLGHNGIVQVAASLRWQAISIGFLAFVHQTTAVFGALGRRRTVVIAATASVSTFLVVGHFAPRTYGHVGVAMATAASTAVQLVVLLALVRREIRPDFGAVIPNLARVLAATGVTALAAWRMLEWVRGAEGDLSSRVRAVLGGGTLMAIHLVAAWMFRCPEITTLRSRLRRPRSR